MIGGPREPPGWLTPAILGLILAGHYGVLARSLSGPIEEFDAVHLYLPLGRELVAQGWAFFADPRSLQAPPLSFIYPMLYGGSIERIKVGNLLLSGATLLLVFRSGALLHSRAAGLIAALLFASSPLLRPYLVAPHSEAPFLFFSALWFWGFAEWWINRWPAALVLSAAGLCAAELTRAPIFYWNIVLVAVLAWLSLRPRSSAPARPLLIAYAAALIVPAALALKNLLLFDFPFYATGGGNALYLGNNPLTGGYDPPYLGLGFDVGAIARHQSQLTLEAERLLRGVANVILAEKSFSFLAGMHLQKLAAFVFVTSAEPDAMLLRAWRIALLPVAALGLFAIKHRGLRWALAGVFVVMLAVHVPVLYAHRYSVSAMDVWLVIAAAVGVAAVARKPALAAATVAVAGVGIGLGAWAYEHAGRPMPDVFAVGRLLVWRSAESVRLSNGAPVELRVRDAPWFRWWNNHVLVLDLELHPDSDGRECRALQVSYAPATGPGFSAPVAIKLVRSPNPRRYQVGGAPLDLSSEGTLQLAANCMGGASITITKPAIYAALGAIDYRERLLGETPLLPVER